MRLLLLLLLLLLYLYVVRQRLLAADARGGSEPEADCAAVAVPQG